MTGHGIHIADVEFVGLRSPLSAPARFSWGQADERNVGLVKITTTEGTVGWGETSVTFPLWSLEERAATISKGIGPLAKGLACGDVDEIRDAVGGLHAATARLRLLWSPVALSASIGALEMALLDALGRVNDQPVWSLLGGERNAIPLYAVGFGGSLDEQIHQAKEALDEGFAAVKVRVGFGEGTDLDTVARFRSGLGEDALIYADANMGWDVATAVAMAGRLNEFGLGWLEEPLSRGELAGLDEVRATAQMPLAAGENCYDLAELERLTNTGAIDVLMPDLARSGGFLVALDGARHALGVGLRYSPHHYASDVGFAAMAALGAVLGPSAPMLRDISAWSLRSELLSEPIEISGGRAFPWHGPGLAPAPDPEVIERHRVT